MLPNFSILLLAAIIPMVMGFIWYNPKTLGNAWMKAADVTEEKMKGANMGVIFGLSYVFSVMLAMAVYFIVVHQSHLFSTLMDESGMREQTGEAWAYAQDFMAKYGQNFRTFKHGLFHGILDGFFFALPILATNAMFERKGFKYIAINSGYWIITLGLMGGVICQFA